MYCTVFLSVISPAKSSFESPANPEELMLKDRYLFFVKPYYKFSIINYLDHQVGDNIG